MPALVEDLVAQSLSFTTMDGIVGIDFGPDYVTLRFLPDGSDQEVDIHMPLLKFDWVVNHYLDRISNSGE